MSGHSGFVKIGNNNPQPIVNNVPVADDIIINNPVNIVQVGDEPNVPANVKPRAADVAGQLDVLLTKAAKNVASGVDANSVAAAANAAGLAKKTVNSLVSLSNKAQESVAALDRFNGRQIAAAMVKKQDGTVEWKPKDSATKAIKAALNAQIKLSSALADALGKAKDGATQAVLEEIMLQCDRRVAEIETLCLQMAEIVEKGGDKVQEKAAQLAGGKLSAFTSKDALDKFDRGSALAAMKAEIKPLADRLAKYAAKGKSLTEEDVASCTNELNALKAKFSEVGASGQIKVGDRTIFCDRSMLAEASRLLDGVGNKIASMHRDIIKAAMKNLVENSFPFLKHDIFKEQFVNELDSLRTRDGETAEDLADFVRQMNTLRNAAREYVESPTPANKAALVTAANTLKDADLSDAADCLCQGFFARATVGMGVSDAFKVALAKFKVDVAGEAGNKMLKDMATTVKRAYRGIDVAVDKLEELAQKLNAGPENKVYVSSWVLGAFRGEQTVSSIVEARAHGYSDSEIDPAIDDANVFKSKELGSGSFNTVTLLTLKDGSEWVFKPEMPGSLTTGFSSHYYGMAKNMEFTRINIAVQRTADTLGLGDVMVKTKAGSHKGKFGMFMEKAPGVTGASYPKAKARQIGEGKLSMTDLRTLGEADFAKVMGRMMRQANRLMWFDILTGQGDRHGNNYLLEIDKNTLSVSLKGIDNDASYGMLRTGFKNITLPADSIAKKVFVRAVQAAAASSGHPNTFMNKFLADPGVKVSFDQTIEIDLDKVENKKLVLGALHFAGLRSAAIPQEIDSELYDKLMSLASDAPDGGAARAVYLESLAMQLGKDSEQYRCAVERLDGAIAHARELKDKGKVYTAEQWETHDVQKSVAKAALKKPENRPDLPKPKGQIAAELRVKSEFMGCTNFMIRELHESLTKAGHHTEWFE